MTAVLGGVASVARVFAELHFSPTQELEADAYAARLLRSLGRDPRAGLRTFDALGLSADTATKRGPGTVVGEGIADYFSTGPDIAWDWELRLDRDLTMSIAWGVYALVLLGAGLWRKRRSLRFVSLGFMLLTVAKVFLVDLSNLEGLHRVFAFLGLAVALILVSLLYQRFLFRNRFVKPHQRNQTGYPLQCLQ